MTESKRYSRTLSILLVVAICLYAAILIRRAWVSDDAFITFRTIDNFLHGFGLTWNAGERVQTYTHPLWMLLLLAASALTRELVFTSMVLSILISISAVLVLAYRLAVSRLSALWIVSLLLLSNAFVDYSSSGLENPLTHLVLVCFFAVFFLQPKSPGKVFWLSLLASLGLLNRMDLLLIFLPALVYALFECQSQPGLAGRQAWLALAAGMLPFLIWESFSVVYYGFLFPNTAYAKLNTGIPLVESLRQGMRYYLESLRSDPLTLAVIGAGLLAGFFHRDRRAATISIGALGYLGYVLYVGGDFMSGRFLAAPFLCALIILGRFDSSNLPPVQVGLLFVAPLTLGLISPHPTFNFFEAELTSRQRAQMVQDLKISNERKFYDWSNGLLPLIETRGIPRHPYAQDALSDPPGADEVVKRMTVGMFGYYANPQAHILDTLALGDPLLARLPAVRKADWRIGHFQRTIPDGYLETLQTGDNLLADSRLAEYYEHLKAIISAPLFDSQRLLEIWRMNSGQYDALIDQDTYRFPKMVHLELSQVSPPGQKHVFGDSGIEIALGKELNSDHIQIGLDGENGYIVEYRHNGQILADQKIQPSLEASPLAEACLETPPQAIGQGFDTLRIFSYTADDQYFLRYIQPAGCDSIINLNTVEAGMSLRYLALGDSYTIGEGVQPADRWPVQLARLLQEQGFAVADPEIVARTGWTTSELARGIQQADPQGQYDLVSLMVGVNNQYRGLDLEEFRDEFGVLLEQAVEFAGGAPARVIVLSIPDWGATPFGQQGDRARASRDINLFNQVIQSETQRVGAAFVDVTPASRQTASDHSLVAPDGLHPSASLYAEWVELALPAVQTALSNAP